MIEHEITLDMQKGLDNTPPRVIVRRGDNETQTIKATLVNNGEAYTPNLVWSARFRVLHADGTWALQNADKKNNIASVTLQNATLNGTGRCKLAYFEFYYPKDFSLGAVTQNDYYIETTQTFELIIEENVDVTGEGAQYYSEELDALYKKYLAYYTTAENAESKRASAESARATAETKRASAESARATAETKRASAESARATAESARAAAETKRASAESARATAESARVTAEETRVSESETAIANANSAAATAKATVAKLNVSKGSATKPIYLDSGTPKECDDFTTAAYTTWLINNLYGVKGVINDVSKFHELNEYKKVEAGWTWVFGVSGTFHDAEGKAITVNIGDLFVITEDYACGVGVGEDLADGSYYERFYEVKSSDLKISGITVDSALSSTSENPVQNKVVTSALDSKADKDHTHNYAGSSSAGGAATSANKLNTNAGSSTTPVYFTGGVPAACTSVNASYATSAGSATTATKLGSSTVGSSSEPVYLNSGTITKCSSITANNATTATTASKLGSTTVGSSTTPIYLNAGTATASTSTVGSSTKPVYLSSGTLTASSSTVGGTTTPVYLSSGTITSTGYSFTTSSTSTSTTSVPTCSAVNTMVKSGTGGVSAYNVLYSSSTYSSATLSYSAANYTYLEIFYYAGTLYDSTKVYSPNYKYINCNIDKCNSADIWTYCSYWYISGTSLKCQANYTFNNTVQAPSGSNEVYIYRVIGYK